MTSDPGRYRWSSHEAYIGGKSTSGIAVEDGLKLWGAHHGQAIKAYQQFIRDGLGADIKKSITRSRTSDI